MSKKTKLIISACLLGQNVRYDASHKALTPNKLAQLEQRFELYPICPEGEGGLPTPRPPCEIIGGDGQAIWQNRVRVLQNTGHDVTGQLCQGAQRALELAQKHHIKLALLKAKSPSCGVTQTYDGSFTGELTHGIGVATALFQTYGISTYDETMLDEFLTNPVLLQKS